MPAGARCDARLLDAAADRERSQPLAASPAWRGEPGRSLFEDLAHPVQRFHVVLERRPAEQANLRDVGRTQARLAALALDRLDHRGLFAADVGACASAQMDRRNRARRIRLQRRDLLLRSLAAAVVLVAKVDIDLRDADRPGRDQRTFEEAVRVAFEVETVLEGAGLALIDVDRHQPGRRLGRDDLPLAARRKARSAEAAQTRVFHRRHDFILRLLAGDAGACELVSACRAIGGILEVARRDDLEVGVRTRCRAADASRRWLDQRGDLSQRSRAVPGSGRPQPRARSRSGRHMGRAEREPRGQEGQAARPTSHANRPSHTRSNRTRAR